MSVRPTRPDEAPELIDGDQDSSVGIAQPRLRSERVSADVRSYRQSRDSAEWRMFGDYVPLQPPVVMHDPPT
jgi:hypothetical protein